MNNLLIELDTIGQLECEDEKTIIDGFMDRYNVDYEEARDIFNETKKWLWLASQKGEHGHSLFIDKPLLILDEMWHTFILHTRQYYNFCLRNFNRFVHHNPTSKEEKEANNEAFSKNREQTLRLHEETIEKQYSLIYDRLGAETLLKWYDTLAQKYTPEYINSIKK